MFVLSRVYKFCEVTLINDLLRLLSLLAVAQLL